MARINADGGCLCRGIRYRVSGEIIGAAACHCRDCQYICGGAPSYVFLIAAQSLEIIKGETASFRNIADNGAVRIRHFCPNCGTPLFAENSLYPSVLSIKAGSLDDPSIYKPAAHFWCQSAPDWHHMDPDIPQFPQGPSDPHE